MIPPNPPRSRKLFKAFAPCILAFAVFGGGEVKAVNNPWPDASYLYRQHIPLPGDPNQNPVNYRLYVPPGYSAVTSAKHPVVIFFHGDGEKQPAKPVIGDPTKNNSYQMKDNGQFAFATTANQAQFPCFFVLIQSYWLNRSILNQTTKDIVAALAAQYKTAGGVSKVDLDRVVVTGLSGGGGGALAQAFQEPGFYAAAVILSTVRPPGFEFDKVANLPSWYFHSADDSSVRVSSTDSIIAGLRAIGANPVYTRYATGGHTKNCWAAAYDTPALIPWLVLQRRGVSPVSDPATVHIVSPTTQPTYVSPTTNITVSGSTVELNVGTSADPKVTQVEYALGTFNTTTNHKATVGSPALWSTPSLALSTTGTTFNAVARGQSWSAGNGGNTFYSDTVHVSYSATPPPTPTPVPVVRVRYDFGSTQTVETGWNNVAGAGIQSLGTSVDVAGVSTTMSLAVVAPFTGLNNGGSTVAGIYPVSAMRDSVYVNAGVTGRLKISGLTVGRAYKITFFASRVITGATRISKYTIGAASTTLDAALSGGNTSATAVLTGILPDANGEVKIDVTNADGSSFGYLGVMEIESGGA